MKLFFILWFFLIVRIVYDLKIRTDIFVDPVRAQKTFIEVFLICLIPVISVFKSIKSIDYNLAFKWIFAGFVFLIPLSFFRNPQLFSNFALGVRLGGNIAFNTIEFGHYGGALVLLALYWKTQKWQFWLKCTSYLLMAVGVFIMLRAGSRGPLVTLLVCLLFYLVASKTYKIWAVGLVLISFVLLQMYGDLFFESIRKISPVLVDRMTLSGNVNQFEELATGRSGLYQAAIDGFVNYPVFGQSFAIFRTDGSYSYSHNVILDTIMGLGLFGGILFLIILFYALRNSYEMINNKHEYWWLAILCVHYIVMSMFSSCFYQSDSLNTVLVIILYQRLYISELHENSISLR